MNFIVYTVLKRKYTKLLQAGKVSFGYIYGISGLGVVLMWALLNIMSVDGCSVGTTASIIGYCILPMVFLSLASVVLSLKLVSFTSVVLNNFKFTKL